MKQLFLSLIYCFFVLSLPAQAQWQWLNPTTTTYSGQVVRFVDADHGFVLQELGMLLRTNNAGLSWQEVHIYPDAADLDFSPQGTGYLLTRPGVLWRSPDGGRTWSRVSGAPQTLPPYSYGYPQLQHTYIKVHAISADTVVEVAADGLVRHSMDGGRHWQQFESGVTRVLSSSFVSGRVGFLGSGEGRIYKTINGGAAWTKLSEVAYFPSEINMLHFLTPRIGFAHREHSDLLRTADGGLTWALVSSRLEDINEMHFLSSTVGFAAGGYATIYSTTDGGLTWTLIGPAATSGFIGGTNLRSVRFTSPTTGYVAGRTTRGPLLRTTDGGRTWLPTSPMMGNILAVNFPGHGLIGYAMSTTGLMKTTDGGDSWGIVAQVGGNQMSCPDANTVVIAGGGGNVARSGDGGRTWTTTIIPGRYSFGNNLVALHMATSQIGYVAGEDNSLGQVLARTADGGRTWQVNSNTSMNGLRHFNFVNASTGFATSAYRGVYKTTDSGQSWQLLNVISYSTIKDLHFVDEQVGYAVDDYGTVYKTTNSGTSWTTTQVNNSRTYAMGHGEHIRFLDRNNGCVQDDNASVFRTTDGGRTWTWERNLGSQAMDYTHNGQSLVLGGGNGMLIRHSLMANALPFKARVLPPVALTDSSAVLAGVLRVQNCIVDSLNYEYGPVSRPGYGQTAMAGLVPWYGSDSVQATIRSGLQPTTTYRVRMRFVHNGVRYYSTDTTFTTPAREVQPEPALTAFPNPTTGYLRVVAPGGRAAAHIELFTLQGALTREATGSGVDLTGLPSGMYLLRVSLGEQVYRRRIMKQ